MSRSKFDALTREYNEMRRAIDAAGVSLWTWDVNNGDLAMDSKGHDLWDVPPCDNLTFEHLSEKIHPADRDRVRASFNATRTRIGQYEIDFRTLNPPHIKWISARGQGNDADILAGKMSGIFLDITGRKLAEEGNELLAGEMSHRVKNLLTIASALTRITLRSSETAAEMAKQLTIRLTALGRAHELVRPEKGSKLNAALLGDLFTVLLAPYDETGAFPDRIRVAVPRMAVGEATATSLALVVHELATNSIKHGALSAVEGLLDVSGHMVGDDVEIVWAEQGGPELSASPELKGFGHSMVRQTIEGQLGGSIVYDWTPNGALVTLRINSKRLSS